MRAACEVLVPPAMPSSRSGRARPSSAKNTRDSQSSWCWPVCTRISSWRSRSGPDTAAALMNWGRLPTTVRIRTGADYALAALPAGRSAGGGAYDGARPVDHRGRANDMAAHAEVVRLQSEREADELGQVQHG